MKEISNLIFFFFRILQNRVGGSVNQVIKKRPNDVGVAAQLAVRECMTARVWILYACMCVRACVRGRVGVCICIGLRVRELANVR